MINGVLLYGTNAVGKTSLIRAMGICVVLAQSGMFVPASSFTYYLSTLSKNWTLLSFKPVFFNINFKSSKLNPLDIFGDEKK